jgi:hypothetical protein
MFNSLKPEKPNFRLKCSWANDCSVAEVDKELRGMKQLWQDPCTLPILIMDNLNSHLVFQGQQSVPFRG